jgi:hypothetical protein
MIRSDYFSGSFYPSVKKNLEKQIQKFLNSVPPLSVGGDLRALIVPHAGYIYSGQVAACGYKLIADLVGLARQRFILLGPSHYLNFEGLGMLNYRAWRTPLGNVESEIPKEVFSNEQVIDLTGREREHSLEVQLPFLQSVSVRPLIVPFLTGKINVQVVAEILSPLLDDQSVLIVSSDLSHYLSYSAAIERDKEFLEAVCGLDFKKVQTGEACGKTGILGVLYMAKKFGWKLKLLCYKNSGDTFGTKDSVVGYASIAVYKT